MSNTRRVARKTVDMVVAWSIALAAAAGGLIHLKASVDHRHLTLAAIGFAMMGVSQWIFAGSMLVRPFRSSLIWGGALHAGILLVWILSRTIGLPLIPGAEQTAPVGVADLVANTFSMAVVGGAVVAPTAGRAEGIAVLRSRAVNTIKSVLLIVVLVLSVPALTEVHDHDHAIGTQPVSGQYDSISPTPATHAHSDHPHTVP